MEKNTLIETTYKIAEALKDDKLVLKTKELESKLMEDPNMIRYIAAFNKAQSDYNDAVRHDIPDRRELANKLSKAKEELYNQEPVKKYFASLKETQEFLDEVTEKLFTDLIDGFAPKKRIGK